MKKRGFTLIETVIAIGVLAVLVSAFFAVFFPATEGIRRSLSEQEADRLSSALEFGVSNLPNNGTPTSVQIDGISVKSGFDKAYALMQGGKTIFVYSYRTENKERNADGTMKALATNQATDLAGVNIITVPVMRSAAIPQDMELMQQELTALDGRVFMVKIAPMSLQNGVLIENADGKIKPLDSATPATGSTPDEFPDAAIPYVAKFYEIPTSDMNYLKNTDRLTALMQKRNPIFTRNMAVRR